MYMENGLNKFLTPLSGIEKFLSGSTRSLAYTDHIIQFGLNNVTPSHEHSTMYILHAICNTQSRSTKHEIHNKCNGLNPCPSNPR